MAAVSTVWAPFQIQLDSAGSGSSASSSATALTPSQGYNWQCYVVVATALFGQEMQITVAGSVVAAGGQTSGAFAVGGGQTVIVSVTGGVPDGLLNCILMGQEYEGNAAQPPLPTIGSLLLSGGGGTVSFAPAISGAGVYPNAAYLGSLEIDPRGSLVGAFYPYSLSGALVVEEAAPQQVVTAQVALNAVANTTIIGAAIGYTIRPRQLQVIVPGVNVGTFALKGITSGKAIWEYVGTSATQVGLAVTMDYGGLGPAGGIGGGLAESEGLEVAVSVVAATAIRASIMLTYDFF